MTPRSKNSTKNSRSCSTLLRLSLIFASLLGSSCATVDKTSSQYALVDQILKPRLGYVGLTNRICDHVDEKGKCVYVVTEYKLEDADFRKKVNDLGFICNLAGKRYKICLSKAGLCRMQRVSCGFLCHEVREVEYLPVPDKYQFYIDGNLRCFQKDKYPFEAIGQ